MTPLLFPAKRFEGDGTPEDVRKAWRTVWTALSDYIQPNSKLSLDDAINQTVEFYEDGYQKLSPIIGLSIYLGDHIPYDNPAHTKLANYFLALGESQIWTSRSSHPVQSREIMFYQHMNENLSDELVDPPGRLEEGEDPMEYVNGQAFAANFMRRHLISKRRLLYVIDFLEQSMNQAFNQNHSAEPPNVRDAWALGAAQWILWKAEEAFSLVQKPGDPAIEKVGAEFCFWQKEKKADAIGEIWPYTWEQWQGWKAGFRAVARSEEYGLTCRNLAERAADLMGIQEKSVANGYPESALLDSKLGWGDWLACMQTLCHLSRRWHQQFCRSPTFGGHAKCVQRWYSLSPPTLSRQRRGGSRTAIAPKKATVIRSGDLVVREYEQDDESDASTRRPVDHGENPFVKEAQHLKSEMQRLDDELARLKKGGPLGPDSPLIQSIPKDVREQLLRELGPSGFNYESIQNIEALDDMAPESDSDFFEKLQARNLGQEEEGLEVTMSVADRHKPWIRQFNGALLAAKEKRADGDPTAHVLLWKWYLRCQQKITGFSAFVNEDVWQFLWQSQMKTYPKTKHVIVLANDMMVADVQLSPAQQLDYIDALHATGDTASAIQEWEKAKQTISEKVGEADAFKAVAVLGDLATRFWATGVQLYAAVGRPAKAETIAFKSLASRPDGVQSSQACSVLVDVVRAWAHSQRTDADVKLWSCYMLVRQTLAGPAASESPAAATSVSVDVLGQITSVLLQTGRTNMALAVFRDMLAAYSGSPALLSSSLDQQVSKAISSAQGTADAESIINRIGLAALLGLPSRFKNKFFFGAWIKWLLGQGKTSDAAMVVELMQEYGVRPDARHLNGIIGAWLRDGSATARTKAEQMAWAMIHARIELVKSRSKSPSLLQPLNVDEEVEPNAALERLPPFLRRNLPPATIETFSLLLLRYTRASDVARATQLTDIMVGPADIAPNSFILNHWLRLSLRASDLDAIIARYNGTKLDIEPDLETFVILWDGCRRNLDLGRDVNSKSYLTPRQLFSETSSWFASLSPQKQATVRNTFAGPPDVDPTEESYGQLYEQMIRCFCFRNDLRGIYIVLDQLDKVFGQLPHESIAGMIVMQVARSMPRELKRGRKPALKRRDEAYRAALSTMIAIMDRLTTVKGGELAAKAEREARTPSAHVVEQLGEDESRVQRQARLDALKTFVILVLRRVGMVQGREEDGLVDSLLETARDMLGDQVSALHVNEIERRLEEARDLDAGAG
ncbi:hypothetical protein DV735_g975, partial [Chaetothyriales sp. CBS 134920]